MLLLVRQLRDWAYQLTMLLMPCVPLLALATAAVPLLVPLAASTARLSSEQACISLPVVQPLRPNCHVMSRAACPAVLRDGWRYWPRHVCQANRTRISGRALRSASYLARFGGGDPDSPTNDPGEPVACVPVVFEGGDRHAQAG